MTLGDGALMVVAGEASGDLHAGRLLEALLPRMPRLRVFGMGGEAMRRAGAEVLHDASSLAVPGLGDVLGVLPRLRRIRRELVGHVQSSRAKAVVLVDYPGFNLALARALRRLSPRPKLIYFIAPQVWAWGGWRARTIAGTFDLVLNILPFEPPYFVQEGGRAEYVGNPVAHGLREAPSREAARAALGIGPEEKVVALLPGSRPREVERHLGPMLGAARLLGGRSPGTRFLVSEADVLPEGAVAGRVNPDGGLFRAFRGRAHEVVRAADAAVVASGTASLEAGLLGTPMVVVYVGDFLAYLLAKYFFIRVDYLSLVNLLAGHEVAKELYQREVRAGRIAEALWPVLTEPEVREWQLAAFGRIRRMLEGPDPYACAAERIHRLLETGE